MEVTRITARTTAEKQPVSQLSPGDHLCCIYDGDRQYRQTLTTFLTEGLRLGQKALFLYPNHDPRPLMGWLARTGADIDQLIANEQLILRDSIEIFGKSASFDPQRAYARLCRLLAQTQANDPAIVRAAADMRWTRLGAMAVTDPDSGEPDLSVFNDNLAYFEQLVNTPGRFPYAHLLCLYDRRWQPELLHPRAVAAHNGLLDGSQNSAFASLLSTSALGSPGPEVALARAHAALAETETRYRLIFNAASEAIIIYEIDGRIIDVNRVAYERMGYARAEMIGESADIFEAPELAGQFAIRADLLRRYGAITYETVHAARGGETLFPVEVNARLIDYDGRPVILNIARDITERKHAELTLVNVNQELASTNSALKSANAALRESEQKFRSLVESSPDGVALVDTTGRLIEFNSALESIFGLPASSVIGLSLVDFYFLTIAPEKDEAQFRKTVQEKIDAALRSGQAGWLGETLEFEVRRPDGSRRLIETTIFPINTQRGYMIGVMTRDITSHRKAEKELEQYRQQLEEMVAERTAQLRREIRERLQVEENLEVMLREVHHRVKNNLNVMIALIDLQKTGQTDPHVLEVFQDLQNRAYSMSLVHESLYRSPNLAQVDFSSYLRTLGDYLQAAYVPTCCGLPVDVRIESEQIPLRIETAIPCGLIVSELVTNAMKYAFVDGHEPCIEGHHTLGEISVRLEHGEGPTAREFVITVCDNGAGFAPGFDWQSTSTLGLQLVRVLARQLGGTLTLDDAAHGVSWRLLFEERL